MEDDLKEIVVDAVKIDQNRTSATEWSEELCGWSKQSLSVIEKLSSSDLKIMLFLLIDTFGLENYLKTAVSTKEELKLIFLDLCQKNGLENNSLIIELLGTMKKYKLLKDLGYCKHRFKSRCAFRFIHNIWKFLFLICDDLTDSDVMKLKIRLLQDCEISTLSAEELFANLLHHKVITKTDLSKLETVFKELPRPDLVGKIKQFQRECSEKRTNYNIRTPTVSKPCGVAVVFNQVNFKQKCPQSSLPILRQRKGSYLDKDHFVSVCKEFGLRVEEYTDLSAEKMESEFKMLSKRDHSDVDVFVACILSHGEQGYVYGSDCIKVEIENLIALMANNCPTLNGKPKLFFIQACQGNQSQEGLFTSGNLKQCDASLVTDEPVCPREIPKNCDVLKAMATIPGFVSYRSEEYGSWFITALVDNLRKFGDKEDIESVLKRVKAKVADSDAFLDDKWCKQMPVEYSTLRYNVVFKRLRQ